MTRLSDGPGETIRRTLDFDEGPRWLPQLRRHLAGLLPTGLRSRLAASTPEDPYSARATLDSLVDRRSVIESVRTWVSHGDVFAYHGTRLNDVQRASVERHGLKLLSAAERIPAIEEFLERHPRWSEVSSRVPEAIEFVNRQGGRREGMIHALLSRSGLVRGCNHYLVEGSEFDHHVANYLLGEICHDENRLRGQGMLIQIRLSGREAIAAANPKGLSERDPNLIGELIEALAWWLATGDDDTEAKEEGCGLVFYEPIPANRIEAIFPVADDVLWPHYDNRAR